jgi:hypothetical protein
MFIMQKMFVHIQWLDGWRINGWRKSDGSSVKNRVSKAGLPAASTKLVISYASVDPDPNFWSSVEVFAR